MLACGFPSEAPVPLMITVDARHTRFPQSHQTLRLMICYFPGFFRFSPPFQDATVFFFLFLNCNVLKDNNACYVRS